MIRTIRLRRFRGFSEVTLPLKRLTVLLGPNSSGKSTFGAALVALREIHESKTGEPSLAPDPGRSWPVDLGSYKELFHERSDAISGQDDVEIAVELGSGWVEMGFGGRQVFRGESSDRDLLLTRLALPGAHVPQTAAQPTGLSSEGIQVVQKTGDPLPVRPPGHRASEFKRQNAEVWRTETDHEVQLFFRGLVTMGALLAHSRSDVSVETQAQVDLANVLGKLSYLRANRLAPERKWADAKPASVGASGEWTPQFLFHNRTKEVVSGIAIPPPSSPSDAMEHLGSWLREEQTTLIDAVTKWCSYLQLADDITSESESGGIVLRARIRGQGSSHDLTDVGFGISQVLPVLVAGIVTPRDGLVILDQPESQLHPRSQAALADFLCMLAMTGRSVLVETHSEALFHRLRLRAAMDEDLARSTKVYFIDAPADACCEPRPISLAPDAALQWPEGFLAEGMLEELSIRAVLSAKAEGGA